MDLCPYKIQAITAVWVYGPYFYKQILMQWKHADPSYSHEYPHHKDTEGTPLQYWETPTAWYQ